MASVTIRDIHKSYGSTPVLKGIDLDIADGEFAVLVGPSGCGKSTLLRMIAGLEDISQGDIQIGPRRVNDLAPKDRDIAMVFQNYALYPHMSVADNLSFALRLAKLPPAEIAERTRNAAQILGLDSLLDRFPRQLSGGQRQRVAMGRAIVRQPQAFLFDEPLSNLDAKLRVSMRTEIKALHQRLRTTAVYVTHDQVEAMTMADRIVVLHEGRIAQQGAPLQLYDDPDSSFVAQFIGSPSMNMLRSVFDGNRVQFGAMGSLPKGQVSLSPGQAITTGVRPEHWRLVSPDSDEGLAATLLVIEPTGADTLLHLNLDGQPLCAQLRERVDARPGDVLRLSAEPARIYHFDPATGMRIR